ncbi:hypothetical protein FRC08_015732 [Ceratobasidium sp. 394]|nr:hypothetical protein FRC08_015732 [Ceratobasidium sp. 394]
MDIDDIDADLMDLDQDLDGYGEPGSDAANNGNGDEVMAYLDDSPEREATADLHEGNVEVHPGYGPEQASQPNTPEPSPQPGVSSVPRRHGYATVEVHEHAARVIRWEYLDDEPAKPDTGDALRQRELFLVAEWLARLPISDHLRAEYLSLEMVGTGY